MDFAKRAVGGLRGYGLSQPLGELPAADLLQMQERTIPGASFDCGPALSPVPFSLAPFAKPAAFLPAMRPQTEPVKAIASVAGRRCRGSAPASARNVLNLR